MKGDGNNFSTLFQKLFFMLIPTAPQRSRYIQKHANEFRKLGTNVHWQPRLYPADPELLSIGSNVRFASGVNFNNHDGMYHVMNQKYETTEFVPYKGCIDIGDNVWIGSNVTIMPDVKIGSNVVIGGGAIVTKDIPDNSVAAGVPCRVIGSFDALVEKRRKIKDLTLDELWAEFEKKHSNK